MIKVKNFLYFFLSVILISCNSNDSGNSKIATDAKKVQIDFLKTKIAIPDSYVEVSLDDFKEKLSNAQGEHFFKVLTKEKILNLESTLQKFKIFIDKDNVENVIWVFLGKYVSLNKELAKWFSIQHKQEFNDRYAQLGCTYTQTENKFLTARKFSAIKIKSIVEKFGNKKYQTEYIISLNKKTFGVFISNYEDINFDNYIRLI